MQPSCSHRKNTETSWLPFRGQSVSGDATVCNALFNIMHNHSLPYLGPLYSSLLHLLEKESCTLNVSQKKKVQTWPSVITKKRQSVTTERDSSGCSCVYGCGLEWTLTHTHTHTNNTRTHVMSEEKCIFSHVATAEFAKRPHCVHACCRSADMECAACS